MAVVLSPDEKQVLLLRREIFILWDIPGGKVERGEGPAEAVVRETLEETGYQIRVDRFVGLYLCQSVYGRGDQMTHVYRAQIVGGKGKKFGLEVAELRWFPVTALPRGLQPLHRRMIADALARDPAPVQRRVDFPRWKLYPARVAFILMAGIQNAISWIFRLR